MTTCRTCNAEIDHTFVEACLRDVPRYASHESGAIFNVEEGTNVFTCSLACKERYVRSDFNPVFLVTKEGMPTVYRQHRDRYLHQRGKARQASGEYRQA
jgi:hypothetical protein